MGALKQAAILAFAGTAVTLVGCSPQPDPAGQKSALGDQAITVASFNFPESELLAEIYGQALEGGGFDVEFAARLGPRELVQPALAAGLVELVPEYSGTALQFLSLGTGRADLRPHCHPSSAPPRRRRRSAS